MITFRHKGDFKKTTNFLTGLSKRAYLKNLEKYGDRGVKALAEATPKKTGLTSKSWKYEIKNTKNEISITWYNTNIQNGINVAVILDVGHATGGGGYVAGRNYIHPAIQPIFDEIADDAWEEVKAL